jgi:general secretion pathway protein A
MTALTLDYNGYFGFRHKPFNAQDSGFYYGTDHYQTAYRDLLSALYRRCRTVLLTGVAASGKSLMLRRLLGSPGANFEFVVLQPTRLSFNAIIDICCEQVSLTANSWHVNNRLQLLRDYLEICRDRGKSFVLLVDDADRLSRTGLLELLQLARTIGRGGDNLQLLLTGKPAFEQHVRELADTIQADACADVLCRRLQPLTPAQAKQFIYEQIRSAGARPRALFSTPVIKRLHRHSGGVLGLLSTLCDHALLATQLTGAREVPLDIVDQVAVARGIYDRTLIGRPQKTLRLPVLKLLQEIESQIGNTAVPGIGNGSRPSVELSPAGLQLMLSSVCDNRSVVAQIGPLFRP